MITIWIRVANLLRRPLESDYTAKIIPGSQLIIMFLLIIGGSSTISDPTKFWIILIVVRSGITGGASATAPTILDCGGRQTHDIFFHGVEAFHFQDNNGNMTMIAIRFVDNGNHIR